MPVVTDYTALLSGDYWNGIEVTGKPVIVTYSFPTTAAGYLADVDGFTPATISSFQAFNATEQDQARAALGEWAAASGLIFVEVAPGQGDINFQLVDFDTTSGPSYAGAGGIGFYPFGDWNYFTYPSFASDIDGSGDVFMNSQFASGGSVTYGTLLHEIGHAIGLKHPTEVVTNYAAYPVVTHDQVLASDDPALTIMAEVGGPGISEHLKTLDQEAAAFIYGPAGTGQVVTLDASGANATVSSWSWNASTQTLTQVGFAGDDTVRGSSVTDVISGLDGNDRLFGLNGDDALDGGAGNDLLNGGPGDDTLTGGAGDDTYMVDGGGDTVVELEGEGFDSVLAGASFTLAANIELLQLFGAGLTGTGNDLGNTMYGDGSLGSNLYGLGGDDYMVGGSGADTLDGGTGVDAMFGGVGDDTYYVDDAADTTVESKNAGTDQVFSSVSYSLAGQYAENLTLTGSGNTNATGNSLANTLTGNSGNNVLNGGTGADTMAGGAGDDTYYVNATSDSVIEVANSGTDQVFSSVSYSLSGQHIENLTLTGSANTNVAGNSLANILVGNSGNNVLNGGTGADTMTGGAGDDTYVVDNAGDTVVEASGSAGGTDLVQSSVSFSLSGQYIENLTLTGSGNTNATGNSLANTLTGNSGNNSLNGGTGSDVLNGGAGTDVLTGGSGLDTFVFDSALAGTIDTVADFSAANDTIRLDQSIFTAITTLGTLSAAAFFAGPAAHDADDRIVYNAVTGNLFYDSDGTGANAAVQFAQLNGTPAISNTNFTVVA